MRIAQALGKPIAQACPMTIPSHCIIGMLGTKIASLSLSLSTLYSTLLLTGKHLLRIALR